MVWLQEPGRYYGYFCAFSFMQDSSGSTNSSAKVSVASQFCQLGWYIWTRQSISNWTEVEWEGEVVAWRGKENIRAHARYFETQHQGRRRAEGDLPNPRRSQWILRKHPLSLRIRSKYISTWKNYLYKVVKGCQRINEPSEKGFNERVRVRPYPKHGLFTQLKQTFAKDWLW